MNDDAEQDDTAAILVELTRLRQEHQDLDAAVLQRRWNRRYAPVRFTDGGGVGAEIR